MSEKVVHRFWAGPRDLPEAYAEFGYQWDVLNPEYSLRMWGEDDLVEFDWAKPIFDDLYERDAGNQSTELYVQMADVMGYAIVQRYGGVYVNCDMEPVRPLPAEMPRKAWASYENTTDGRVVNAAIGAPEPQDEFWSRLVSELPDNYFKYRLEEMIVSTGPAYLTRHAEAHPEGIHVFPVESFNSVHWSDVPRGGDASGFSYPEGAIAVHHWGHRKDGRTNTIERPPHGASS